MDAEYLLEKRKEIIVYNRKQNKLFDEVWGKVKKRIKDDVLIDERIQILRLHYDYLKTAMKYLDPKLLDRSKYTHWNLKMVESHSFNSWWSKLGKKVLGRKLDAIKEVNSSSKRRNNTILVEIPLDNPTEYSIEKIRDIINSNFFDHLLDNEFYKQALNDHVSGKADNAQILWRYSIFHQWYLKNIEWINKIRTEKYNQERLGNLK